MHLAELKHQGVTGMEDMMAAVFYGPGDMRVETVEKPRISSEEVLIRVGAVGICGSDFAKWLGKMRTRVLPLILGHEFSGVIADVGDEADFFSVGDRVTGLPHIPCMKCHFCRLSRYCLCLENNMIGSNLPGAYAEYVKLPARNLATLPENVAIEQAATTDILLSALYSVEKGLVKEGDSVAILGFGAQGFMALQAAKVAAASEVFCTDIMDSRLKLAESMGGFPINVKDEDAVEIILGETGGLGVDSVIEASGAPSSVHSAFRIVKKGGRIVQLGIPHEPITLDYFSAFMEKDVELIGFTRCYYSMRYLEKALRLISEGAVNVQPLVSHAYPLEQVGDALELLKAGEEVPFRIMLKP